jgi:NOL1/NOP2/fmu family ribosome biogenesis protein
MTDIHVTEAAAEIWYGGADVRVTQVGVEAWYVVTPALIVTQLGAEVWQSVAVLAPAGGGARRMLAQIL